MSAPAAPSVQSLEDFLRVVRASGLIDQQTLDAAVAAWTDLKGPVPEALTQALLERELLSDWQLGQLRRGKHKGFFLGKYKLIRELGAGGMGTVFLGEDTDLIEKVAIKVLPPKRVEQTSYFERFRREAKASFRLNHPNIARFFGFEHAGAIHFIVMEFVGGTDLQSLVKSLAKDEKSLTVREAVDFIRQAALGLQHAHDAGLVHRDIKPGNLMVDNRGTVKVLDLGLALSKQEDTSVTKHFSEKMLGTADYLAPEQADDSHGVDHLADIYSLGCTLHYLLTGTPPFNKGLAAERIRAHKHSPPPNLLDSRPEVPAAIVELYFRMMEKDRKARPHTAQEVADALANWLASTTEATPRKMTERPSRESLRRSSANRQTPASSPSGASTATPVSTVIPGAAAAQASAATQASMAGQGAPQGFARASGPGAVPAAGSDQHPGHDASALSFLQPGAAPTPARPQQQPAPTEAAAWGGIQINTAPTGKPAAVVPAKTPAAGAKPVAVARGGRGAAGLARRFGPLPLWAWLLAAASVIGAAGAGTWFVMQGGASDEATSGDERDEPQAEPTPEPKPKPKPKPKGGEKAGANSRTDDASRPPTTTGREKNSPTKQKPKKPAEPEPSGPSLLDDLDSLKRSTDAAPPDGEKPPAGQ